MLKYKAFRIDKNRKCGAYQHRLGSIIYEFFDRKSAGCNNSGSGINSENQ